MAMQETPNLLVDVIMLMSNPHKELAGELGPDA
jgi:hypothetical protein